LGWDGSLTRFIVGKIVLECQLGDSPSQFFIQVEFQIKLDEIWLGRLGHNFIRPFFIKKNSKYIVLDWSYP
jgi:hypothetical protein